VVILKARCFWVHHSVGKTGLRSRLYAATTEAASSQAFMQEFLRIMREVRFATLERIEPLE